MRAEQMPDDPAIPLAEEIRRWQNIPRFVEVNYFAVWNADESEAIAAGGLELTRLEQNKHLAEFHIEVLPAFRRRGIARQLLAKLADIARESNRTLLITNTSDRVPAGEAFMTRLGAQRGMETHLNQLDLDDLKRDRIRDWLARAPECAAGYELKFLDGPVPDEMLTQFVELFEVMNTAPNDNLRVEDCKFTAEQYRQMEKSQVTRGGQRWVFYV